LSILDVIKNRKDYGNGALLLTGMACLIVGAILFAMKK
jgi:diacylglycerol kinase